MAKTLARDAFETNPVTHGNVSAALQRRCCLVAQAELEGLRGQLGGAEGLSAQLAALQRELDDVAAHRDAAELQR